MIDRKIAEREGQSATGAFPLLKSKEFGFVRVRTRQSNLGRRLGQVGSCRRLGKHKAIGERIKEWEGVDFFIHNVLQTQLGDVLRVGRYVNPYPLPSELFRRDTCRSTPAERIPDHITDVATCLEDVLQQCQRLLRRVTGVLFTCNMLDIENQVSRHNSPPS